MPPVRRPADRRLLWTATQGGSIDDQAKGLISRPELSTAGSARRLLTARTSGCSAPALTKAGEDVQATSEPAPRRDGARPEDLMAGSAFRP